MKALDRFLSQGDVNLFAKLFEVGEAARFGAETPGLHIKTVRQRLDALRAAMGGGDDPMQALELQVALRLKTNLD